MEICSSRIFTPPQTFAYTPQFQIPRNNPAVQPTVYIITVTVLLWFLHDDDIVIVIM